MNVHICQKLTSLSKAIATICFAAFAQDSFVGQAMAQVEFDDAEFFIEINGTDGDAGVQLKLDGEGWNSLEMTNPIGGILLELQADENESIGFQGLTEFFFESAEPSFDDQTLAELFALFPEGEYEFEGTTTEGETIIATAEFTHNIPAIPEPEVIVFDDNGVQITWEMVEDAFDDPNGAPVGDDIEIDMYRVIVEALDEEGEGLGKLDVELPATSERITIPREFVALSPVGEFKFEVIATEESGNQTIVEGEFDATEINGTPVIPSRLVNISSRSVAGTGKNTQIAGFVVSPGEDKQVLIRAVGPGLESQGVDDFVADPSITVFNADGDPIAENDDWVAAEIGDTFEAVGAFDLDANSADAAILLTLAPGLYTTHVGNTSGVEGIVLLEVYEVID